MAVLTEWAAKYEALSSRERMLVLAVVVFVLYYLVTLLMWDGLIKTANSQEDTYTKLQQQNQQLSTQLQLFTGLSSSDPDKAKKQQVAALKSELEQLDQSLSNLSVGLIPADQLPLMLQDVLKGAQNLTLTKIETLPISELSLRGNTLERKERAFDAAQPAADEAAGVFKHSVVIDIKGRYFDVKRYVEALENLSWRLYWERLSYSVSDYPTAEARIQVYTLSTEEGVFSE